MAARKIAKACDRSVDRSAVGQHRLANPIGHHARGERLLHEIERAAFHGRDGGGISECPEITITGGLNRISAKSLNTSRPEYPGNCRSRITQAGDFSRTASRNVRPSLKPWVAFFFCRCCWSKASQTDLSSSTKIL